MGMDLNIYTQPLSSDLIPKIKKRFADYKMDVEFHPDFKFNEEADTGFLPIKLKVLQAKTRHYDLFESEVYTGFEIYFDKYNYQEDLKSLHQVSVITEKKSFLRKLFGPKKVSAESIKDPEVFVGDKQTDDILKHCTNDTLINWVPSHTSELRVSLFFAAFLAEQAGGIIYDPQNERYLTPRQALEIFPNEIEEFELSVSTEDFVLDRFEEWY
ncbi:MAG: hypothetical protein C5B52_06515 [Bacteroidetes bacterium]|nr:MAG: hypothetical protein C5B52_06515 [Bacteroidota bacterium]